MEEKSSDVIEKDEENTQKLIEEIKREQQISPFFEDSIIENYIEEGKFDINYSVGCKIDYEKDLKARRLLKNYVLYTNHKRLAEFKQLYRRRICRITN